MTQDQPRHSAQQFPPYTYVPGRAPHPVSDPAGHMHGHEPPQPPPLDPDHWQDSDTYLFGIDLFNHGYYWEAHEAWESLWHAAERQGTVADFLKGLIKLAAAGVKSLEENPAGVERHTNRAVELLSSVSQSSTRYCGINLESVLAKCRSDALATITLEPIE